MGKTKWDKHYESDKDVIKMLKRAQFICALVSSSPHTHTVAIEYSSELSAIVLRVKLIFEQEDYKHVNKKE